jgi:polysaccharide pyruvyl transferase WcaK-like protein
MINIYSIRPKGFNVGNDVIYIALQHFLRNAFKDKYFNIISLPATNKYESHKKAGFSKGTVYEFNQFGDGVILGGGNLFENGEIDIDPIALRALDKPLMIFSVSRGKIYNNRLELVDRTDVISDSNLRILHDAADFSLSRDKATCDYLKELNLNNIIGACPTVFLNEVPYHTLAKNSRLETDCLISIRTPNLMSVPPTFQYQLRSQIMEMASILREKGYKNIKILCHDHRDIPFAESFQDIGWIYTDDVYTFITLLKNTKLNLTYRLHSFIPCLSLGVPTIKISYDQRSISLVDTIGMDEWNINYVHDNVIEEFKNRMAHLGDLDQIRNDLSKSTWKDIKETISGNFNQFAKQVMENKYEVYPYLFSITCLAN